MTLFLFLFSDICRSILPVIDMKERDRLIKQYFQMGYTYNEIIGFLFCVHGIMLSLRTLKRTLRRMGLKKNGTEAPISVIVQTVVNLQQQGYRISGIFRVGLIFAEFATSLKSPKIDTAKNKPYYTSSLRVLEIAKIGLNENLTHLPSVIFAKISRREKFQIYGISILDTEQCGNC